MPVLRRSTLGASVRLAVFVLCVAPSVVASAPASEAELFHLANGMRWIAESMESPGEVTILFYMATGSAHESAATRGAVATLVELWRLATADEQAARGAAATACLANPDFAIARATWPSQRLAEAVSFAAAHWLKPDAARLGEARTKAAGVRDQRLEGRLSLYWEMCRAAYAVHPYGRPHYGEKGDLERLGEAAFRAYLAAHLVPANLVVVVTGDFDRVALRAAAEREFGSQPRLAAPGTITLVEAPQRGEKRVVVSDAPVDGLAIGFHKEAGAAPGIAAWGVLSDVWKRRIERRTESLSGLVRRFDVEQGPAMRHPNLLFALWETDPGADLRALETAALEEAGRLAVEPLRRQELEEAKLRLAGAPQKPDARAHGQHLADWLAMTGDFRPAFDHVARVRAVTAEQVLALARQAFRPENRTVLSSAIGPAGGGR
jgi:zinc protease